MWQRLDNGKWIFVISQETKISIDCRNKNLIETTIAGTGLVTLPPECVGYCREMQLIPKSNNVITLTSVNLTFNLINDSCCDIVKLKEIKLPKVILENTDLDSLKTYHNKD